MGPALQAELQVGPRRARVAHLDHDLELVASAHLRRRCDRDVPTPQGPDLHRCAHGGRGRSGRADHLDGVHLVDIGSDSPVHVDRHRPVEVHDAPGPRRPRAVREAQRERVLARRVDLALVHRGGDVIGPGPVVGRPARPFSLHAERRTGDVADIRAVIGRRVIDVAKADRHRPGSGEQLGRIHQRRRLGDGDRARHRVAGAVGLGAGRDPEQPLPDVVVEHQWPTVGRPGLDEGLFGRSDLASSQSHDPPDGQADQEDREDHQVERSLQPTEGDVDDRRGHAQGAEDDPDVGHAPARTAIGRRGRPSTLDTQHDCEGRQDQGRHGDHADHGNEPGQQPQDPENQRRHRRPVATRPGTRRGRPPRSPGPELRR